MSRVKAFKIFIRDLLSAYQEFCLNRIIHEKVCGNLFANFKSTWALILIGLEKSYLLGLARLFDQYRLEGKDKNISVYFFLDYKFMKDAKIINKIDRLRNKMLVHSDLKTMLDLEKFLEELNFKSDRSDIESLFNTTIQTFNEIKGNFGFKCDLEKYFEDAKKDVRNKFETWFSIFQKGFN